jgi:hypothetical protein
MLVDAQPPLEEVYLEHFGIKGMHWGQRKAQDVGPGRQHHGLTQNQRRATKAVAIAGGVAVAALLLRRGHINVLDSRSSKMYVGGAKMAGSILGKTGKTLVKSSVKVGTTVGKPAAKGAFKLGTLVGKGAATGTVAGSKAAGRAAIQNGAKFYEKVLKKSAISTVKLGSHAMYKFTGRGTPIVNEVAKSKGMLNPIDLLLNTRADRLGGRR